MLISLFDLFRGGEWLYNKVRGGGQGEPTPEGAGTYDPATGTWGKAGPHLDTTGIDRTGDPGSWFQRNVLDFIEKNLGVSAGDILKGAGGAYMGYNTYQKAKEMQEEADRRRDLSDDYARDAVNNRIDQWNKDEPMRGEFRHGALNYHDSGNPYAKKHNFDKPGPATPLAFLEAPETLPANAGDTQVDPGKWDPAYRPNDPDETKRGAGLPYISQGLANMMNEDQNFANQIMWAHGGSHKGPGAYGDISDPYAGAASSTDSIAKERERVKRLMEQNRNFGPSDETYY